MVGVTGEDTVITIGVALTVTGDAHVNDEVKSQVTEFPFAKVDVVNVVAFVPAGVPFTLHANIGVAPPLVGVAVNVTLEPVQIDVAVAAITTAGVILAFTVINIIFDEAVAEPAQPPVTKIAQLTVSPLFNVLLLNVAVVPTTVLFTAQK